MILKVVCKANDRYLVKIIFKEEEGEKWAVVSEALYNYVKSNFKQGDVVDAEYSIKNGQYTVSRIIKPGTNNSNNQPKENSQTSVKPICKVCKKELKNDKYDTCYTCNQKKPKESPQSFSNSKDMAIKDEVALKASVEAIKVLTGQVSDVDTIINMVKTIYKGIRPLLN